MIKGLIRNIRRKSKQSRDNMALTIAFTVTGIIFINWLYHWSDRLEAVEEKHSNEQVEYEEKEASFTELFKGIGDQFKDVEIEEEEEIEMSDVSDVAPTNPDGSIPEWNEWLQEEQASTSTGTPKLNIGPREALIVVSSSSENTASSSPVEGL